MTTHIVVKYPADIRNKVIDFTPDLQQGDSLLSASLTATSPAGLVASVSNVTSPMATLSIGAGQDNTSYAFNIVGLTTMGNSITYTIAVAIDSQLAYSLQDQNPDAFNTLVGYLEAGQAALAIGQWSFPPTVNCTGGRITWELIDNNGLTYANGNAFTYKVTSTGASNRVEGTALITAPSSIPVNMEGQTYQIRWALYLPGNTVPSYSFEGIKIVSINSIPQGVEDIVEMVGDNITLNIVLDRSYEHVGFEIYHGNYRLIAYTEVIDKQRISDGWLCQGTIDPSTVDGMSEEVEGYTVVWTYWNSANSNVKDHQTGRLFIVNPTILAAVEDVKNMCNKARTTVNGTPDIVFSTPLVLSYLRRGRDAFNGAWGMLTAFSMLGATGGIREYWIMYAEVSALRSQFLAEGEKVFNYAGTAIQLDVDRTGYYDTLATNIQARIDAEIKAFKLNLIKKGIIAGDGNLNNVMARPGSTGAIGINISPANNFGKLAPLMTWRR